MSLILTDKAEAVLPGDAVSPEKWENIEIWTFVSAQGAIANYVQRIERNERATIAKNPIDNTTVEVVLSFREDDKNELVGNLSFVVANLLSYGVEKSRQRVYEKGEDPLSKELLRHKEKAAIRAGLFEQRHAAMEADFEREMKAAGE